MDPSQAQTYLTDIRSLAIFAAGGVIQLLLLGLWHRVRPWGVVVVRTILVQFLLLLTMVVLTLRWPFTFPEVYQGVPLAIAGPELLMVLWYLLQRRGGGGQYGGLGADDD